MGIITDNPRDLRALRSSLYHYLCSHGGWVSTMDLKLTQYPHVAVRDLDRALKGLVLRRQAREREVVGTVATGTGTEWQYQGAPE